MSFVTTELQDAVAVLTIDRPKALNLCKCLCDALAHSAGTDNAYLHSKYLQYKIKDKR